MNIDFISRNKNALQLLSSRLGKNASEFHFAYKSLEIKKASDMSAYDIIVSPANGFGELQGGVDMQFYQAFGKEKLQRHIYNKIKKYYHGEILVGNCMSVHLGNIDKTNYNRYLLLCPTMAIPINVSKTRNAYAFTKAMIKGLRALRKFTKKKNPRVLCPLPCIGVGGMDSKIMALQMDTAFKAISGHGLAMAVYDGGQAYPEYYPGNVAKNSKMAVIQMINGR